jgi:hypothetical protein
MVRSRLRTGVPLSPESGAPVSETQLVLGRFVYSADCGCWVRVQACTCRSAAQGTNRNRSTLDGRGATASRMIIHFGLY